MEARMLAYQAEDKGSVKWSEDAQTTIMMCYILGLTKEWFGWLFKHDKILEKISGGHQHLSVVFLDQSRQECLLLGIRVHHQSCTQQAQSTQLPQRRYDPHPQEWSSQSRKN